MLFSANIKNKIHKLPSFCLPRHHNAGSNVLEFVHILQIRDVLEHKRIIDADLLANLLVHGVHVGLVDSHALLGQRRRVVDRYLVQLGVQ